MIQKEIINLSGKWSYRENYDYGYSKGELIIEQKGKDIKGKIIFTDYVDGESPYMIQESVKGKIEGEHIRLEAIDFDIIDADHDIVYMLDNWYGVLVDENTIIGTSLDRQEIEGDFVFKRMLPM